VYRRRLALAAVASLAIHLLLAKSLAISRLRGDVAADSQAAAKPLTPKRKADFPLAVPRSPSAEQPAHERPVEVRIPVPDRQQRPPPTRPPDRNVAERQAEERSEWKPAAQPQAVRTATEHDTALAAAAATPARDTTVSSAAAAATAADLAAIEPAAAATAARPPAPADAAPVPRAAPAPIASRWRPREVALLERLTAPQASAAARSARDREAGAAAGTAAAPRAAASAAAAAAADASVADIPLPAATSHSRAAVAPAARAATTAAAAAAATAARPSSATGDASMSPAPPTARPADTIAGGRTARADAGDRAATATGNATAPGRQQAATASGAGAGTGVAAIDLPAATKAVTGAAGGPKPAAGGRPAASSPSSALAGGARGAAGEADGANPARIGGTAAVGGGATVGGAGGSRGMSTGRTGDVDAPAGGASPTPGRAAPTAAAAAADGLPLVAIAAPPTASSVAAGGGRPAPAAIGRFAAGGAVVGSAVARPSGAAANDADEDGLSVSVGDVALPGGGSAARRAEAGPGAAEALPPARVAAAALPAEGRVRDVAEAFARRAAGRRGSDRQDTPAAAQAATMVDRGLEFLARSQQQDGRWSLGSYAGITPAEAPKLRSDTAATGLALLGFLGAGHDHFDGPHRDTVRRGLEFLLAAQKPDGDLFLPADDLSNSCAWLYSHGIAAIALCEAVGMTGDPRVKPAAEKACGFIAASQHPARGGWRYTPRSDADLSVSGWMLVAVRSGALGGLKTDPRTLDGVRGLLEAAASKTDSARYAYNPFKPEQRMSPLSSACMTAVGALMRLHTGAAADDPRVVQAARVLAAIPPEYGTATRKTRDSYLWYYASQVLVHTGGPEWERWYGRLVATLAATQESTGSQAGSWDPLGPAPDRWGIYGGRIYVTALHLLALEVPGRHLPTYSAAQQ
jgi:hypothetical protein